MDYYNEKEKDFQNILSARIKPDKNIIKRSEIIIYGAGSTGKRVLRLLKKHGVAVKYFLDIEAGDDMFIDGVAVLKPDDPSVEKTLRVIVALFNHKTDVTSVAAFLKKIGFTDIILYTELFINFSDELPEHYWLGPSGIYDDCQQEITDALALFQDEVSIDLFKSFLKFRLIGNPSCMPSPDFKNIYFPLDIFEMRRPDRFIDCGAFDGDTLLSIGEKFGVLDSIRAFEPDLENFCKLVSIQLNGKQLSKDTVLIPCGAWSSTTRLGFMSDGSLTSGVSEHGNSTIQCVSLDECLNGYAPTLIKMDIEGAEIEALNGCKKIIASAKPDLAISVYHRPDHLWKIPLLVNELNPNYRLYLRSHRYNGYDTVLYAYNKNS